MVFLFLINILTKYYICDILICTYTSMFTYTYNSICIFLCPYVPVNMVQKCTFQTLCIHSLFKPSKIAPYIEFKNVLIKLLNLKSTNIHIKY